MSLKVKSTWRIAANAFGLAVSLWLVGFYLWAGLARHRWHWGFIVFMGVLGLHPVSRQASQRAEEAKGTCTGST